MYCHLVEIYHTLLQTNKTMKKSFYSYVNPPTKWACSIPRCEQLPEGNYQLVDIMKILTLYSDFLVLIILIIYTVV